MSKVYILQGQGDNADFMDAYKTENSARKALKKLVKEYKKDGVKLKPWTNDGLSFFSDFDEIELTVHELKVLK